MFYIKRIQSDFFTLRNINGDVMSTGKDPGYSYVICCDTKRGVCGLSIGGGDINTLERLKYELKEYGVRLVVRYILKDNKNNVTNFETEQDARDVLNYMSENPNQFVRSQNWDWYDE